MVFDIVSDSYFCCFGIFAWLMQRFEIVGRTQEKGLSQKLLIKRMAQPFAMGFNIFWQNKRKSLEIRQK